MSGSPVVEVDGDARTPARVLAEQQLDGLAQLVAELASAGLSWRAISKTVGVNSGGRVQVSHETLRRWYGEAS